MFGEKMVTIKVFQAETPQDLENAINAYPGDPREVNIFRDEGELYAVVRYLNGTPNSVRSLSSAERELMERNTLAELMRLGYHDEARAMARELGSPLQGELPSRTEKFTAQKREEFLTCALEKGLSSAAYGISFELAQAGESSGITMMELAERAGLSKSPIDYERLAEVYQVSVEQLADFGGRKVRHHLKRKGVLEKS